MQFFIENEHLTVTVDSVGCEIVSVKSKNDDTEYIWIADPAYWGGHAPNMFPICGRLTEGKYTYEGKTYEMQLHGFARKCEFTIFEKTPSSISMTLTDDEMTRSIYPFRFVLTITHTLEGATLHTKFTVENKGENVMPYAVGGHPGFNVPLGDAGEFSDYYLEFSEAAPARKLVMRAGYMTEETVPFPLEDGKILHLNHEFFNNAGTFIFDMAKEVTLKSNKTEKSVTLRYDDMTFLGLWHIAGAEAPYVCIEPWTGVPDYVDKIGDIMEKRDMRHLAPSERETLGYSITFGL